MSRRLLACATALAMLLAGCGQPSEGPPDVTTTRAAPVLGVDTCYPGYMMDCMKIPDAKHVWESYGWSQLSNFTDRVGYDLGVRDGWATWYRGFGSDQSHEQWVLDLAKGQYYVLPSLRDWAGVGSAFVHGPRVLMDLHEWHAPGMDYNDYFVGLWEPARGAFTNASSGIDGDLHVLAFDGTWGLLARRDRSGQHTDDVLVLNVDTREWRVVFAGEERQSGVRYEHIVGTLVDGMIYYQEYDESIDGYRFVEEAAASGEKRLIGERPGGWYPDFVASDEYLVFEDSLEMNLGYTVYDRSAEEWIEVLPNLTHEPRSPKVGGEWIVFTEKNPSSRRVLTTNFWAYHIPTHTQVLLTPPQEDYLMYVFATDGQYVLMAGQSNRGGNFGNLQQEGEQIYLKPLPDPYA